MRSQVPLLLPTMACRFSGWTVGKDLGKQISGVKTKDDFFENM